MWMGRAKHLLLNGPLQVPSASQSYTVQFLMTLPLGLWLDHNSTVPDNPTEIKKFSLHPPSFGQCYPGSK